MFKSLSAIFKVSKPVPVVVDQTWSTNELIRLRAANEVKRVKAIEQLGEKWLLHPNNKIAKDAKATPPVLAR